MPSSSEAPGGATTPSVMDSWRAQQRALKQKERESKAAATQALHSFKTASVDAGKTAQWKAQDREKKKEAIETLHSYGMHPERQQQQQQQTMDVLGVKEAEKGKGEESVESATEGVMSEIQEMTRGSLEAKARNGNGNGGDRSVNISSLLSSSTPTRPIFELQGDSGATAGPPSMYKSSSQRRVIFKAQRQRRVTKTGVRMPYRMVQAPSSQPSVPPLSSDTSLPPSSLNTQIQQQPNQQSHGGVKKLAIGIIPPMSEEIQITEIAAKEMGSVTIQEKKTKFVTITNTPSSTGTIKSERQSPRLFSAEDRSNSGVFDDNRDSWISFDWFCYWVLLVVRIVAGAFLLQGYIHPDEFFQGGQELFFGSSSAARVWEFQPQYAIRSIVPPTFLTRVPLAIYSYLMRLSRTMMAAQEEPVVLSGWLVLTIPRLFCAIGTVLAVDWTIWRVCQTQRHSHRVPSELWVLSTSWPVWVLMSRPFSNTMETWCWSLVLLYSMGKNHPNGVNIKSASRWIVAFGVGELCALGIFTRFTFLFFALPLVWYYLKQLLWIRHEVWKFCGFLLGGLVVSLLIVLSDAGFYYDSSSNSSSDEPSSLQWENFITPLNALRYNSSIQNLQQHGLHPRYTHGLINIFILFGPAAFLFYIRILVLWAGRGNGGSSKGGGRRKRSKVLVRDMVTIVCLQCAMSGLFCLSLAPHQEPRFLLPLIVPLSIGLGKYVWQIPKVRIMWLFFNLILGTVFGLCHQGGVVPSMLWLGQHHLAEGNSIDVPIVYYHTYMPPTFLLSPPSLCHQEERTCDSTNATIQQQQQQLPHLIDLKGSKAQVLMKTLEQLLPCNSKNKDSRTTIHLVSPPLRLGQRRRKRNTFAVHPRKLETMKLMISHEHCQLGPKWNCQAISERIPNLTTEDLPVWSSSAFEFVSNLSLTIYEVTCV